MTKRVVISQPMFFPWVGLFEQIRLADTYVHYDDVQFSKGGFTNRVQIKTAGGIKWLTVPLRHFSLGTPINRVSFDSQQPWRGSHLTFLEQAFRGAPFAADALGVVERVYSEPAENIADVAMSSVGEVCRYYGLAVPERRFLRSSELDVSGSGSQRVLGIVEKLDGTVYVTGHGARNYLDHELFERRGIRVEYLDYEKKPYRQIHGDFTPYVSVLDLIANEGRAGGAVISSGTLYWKDFIGERSR